MRFGRVQLGLVRCLGREIGIQLLLRNSALCGERLVARNIGVRVGQIRHRHGHLRLGLLNRHLESVGIYFVEKLSLFYEKAVAIILRAAGSPEL